MTEMSVAPERGRLERRMAELARIGADGSGLSRLGLSAEERQAQDLVGSWLAAVGGRIRRDAAMDLWCRFGGAGPAIVVGSHLDSVPQGGRYDGTLGVLCAVEALEVLTASRVPLARPIEVVAWSNEEGRFGIGLFGSSATFGYLPADVLDRREQAGTSVRDALAALGSDEPLDAARRPRAEMRAYIEPHIEQGPRLDRQGMPLGIVSSIVGLVHGTVTVVGRQGHAGTTPMSDRRDALSGAAEIALALERVARAHAPAVATVGQISTRPRAMNVIPGECAFSIDVRAPDQPTVDRVMDGLRSAMAAVAASRDLTARLDVHDVVPPVPLDPGMRALLTRAAAAVGAEAPEMTSGAGHDAANPQRAGVPTGMLFIRSTGGSHTPTEHASMDDAALGVRALVIAVRELMA